MGFIDRDHIEGVVYTFNGRKEEGEENSGVDEDVDNGGDDDDIDDGLATVAMRLFRMWCDVISVVLLLLLAT